MHVASLVSLHLQCCMWTWHNWIISWSVSSRSDILLLVVNYQIRVIILFIWHLSCSYLIALFLFQDKFLKMIGDKHPHLEFLRSLSSKCMCNIFSSEHVKCILDQLYTNSLGNKYIDASSIKLLLVRRIST